MPIGAFAPLASWPYDPSEAGNRGLNYASEKFKGNGGVRFHPEKSQEFSSLQFFPSEAIQLCVLQRLNCSTLGPRTVPDTGRLKNNH